MKRIACIVEYKGTAYCGWQLQANRNVTQLKEQKSTVQGVIESAIETVVGTRLPISASGRTDAGVHARGQVFHFDTDSKIPPSQWSYVLNNLLPADISIRRSMEVSRDFHARGSAILKTYVYKVYVSKVRRALLCDSHYCYCGTVDVKKMVLAAKFFLGEHDFAAFRSTGSSAKTTVRRITELTITADNVIENDSGLMIEGEIEFRISANGFLYNMVRIIVEQLLRVGRRLIEPEFVCFQIESRDRSFARQIAPPQGLYLHHVDYNTNELDDL